MHPGNKNRNTLVKDQLERILVIKAREAGVKVTNNGNIESGILNEWKQKNRDNIKKWHLEAEAIVNML